MLLQFVRMRFGVALKNGSCGCQRNEEARKYGGMPRGGNLLRSLPRHEVQGCGCHVIPCASRIRSRNWKSRDLSHIRGIHERRKSYSGINDNFRISAAYCLKSQLLGNFAGCISRVVRSYRERHVLGGPALGWLIRHARMLLCRHKPYMSSAQNDWVNCDWLIRRFHSEERVRRCGFSDSCSHDDQH